MSNRELKAKQAQLGDKAGAFAWWAEMYGVRAQKILDAKYPGRGQDAYQASMMVLYEAKDPKYLEMLEEGSFERVLGFLKKESGRALSGKRKGDEQQTFENSAEPQGFDATDETLTDVFASTDEDLDQQISRDTIKALSNLSNPRAAQAFLLQEMGYSFSESAKILGVSSKQSLQRAQSSERTRLELCFAWRTSNEHKICPEIATLLSEVAWRVVDLDDPKQQIVRDHNERCPSCAAILATHERTLRVAPAFFPLPLLASRSFVAQISHFFQSTWASITGRAQDATVSAQAGASSGSWQGARPVAAVAAAAALLVGSGVVGHNATTAKPDSKPAPAQTATGPTELIDRIDLPTRKPVHRKHKKRAARQTITTPAPAASPVPAPKPSTTGDGSSEFLPDGR